MIEPKQWVLDEILGARCHVVKEMVGAVFLKWSDPAEMGRNKLRPYTERNQD